MKNTWYLTIIAIIKTIIKSKKTINIPTAKESIIMHIKK